MNADHCYQVTCLGVDSGIVLHHATAAEANARARHFRRPGYTVSVVVVARMPDGSLPPDHTSGDPVGPG